MSPASAASSTLQLPGPERSAPRPTDKKITDHKLRKKFLKLATSTSTTSSQLHVCGKWPRSSRGMQMTTPTTLTAANAISKQTPQRWPSPAAWKRIRWLWQNRSFSPQLSLPSKMQHMRKMPETRSVCFKVPFSARTPSQTHRRHPDQLIKAAETKHNVCTLIISLSRTTAKVFWAIYLLCRRRRRLQRLCNQLSWHHFQQCSHADPSW